MRSTLDRSARIGLVLYALGASDAGEHSLRRLGNWLVDAASTPAEPLGDMPAELRLDIVTRTSDVGAVGDALEIRIIEQRPAGWSVVG